MHKSFESSTAEIQNEAVGLNLFGEKDKSYILSASFKDYIMTSRILFSYINLNKLKMQHTGPYIQNLNKN